MNKKFIQKMVRPFVTNCMTKERMLRRKIGPVFINYLQSLLVKTIQMGGPLLEQRLYLFELNKWYLSIMKIIVGIHIDTISRIPRHSFVCSLEQVLTLTRRTYFPILNQSKRILRIPMTALPNIQMFID